MLEQRLQKALSSWPNWSIALDRQPEVIKPLSGGQTNQTFLLQIQTAHKTSHLVLRLNSPYSQQLGINRQREKLILQHMAAAKLAPAIYFNDLTVLVTQYVEGNTLTNCQLSTQQQQSYQQLVKRIHDYSIRLPPFSYRNHTEHFWQQLLQKGHIVPPDLIALRNKALAALQTLKDAKTQAVLCHHDAGLHNLMEKNGQMMLIDWEYAALGYSCIDIASSDLTTPKQPEAQLVSDYMNQLWYLVSTNIPTKV